MEENQLRFELHRYLNWVGQAPSYRIGQWIWKRIRSDVARRAGQELDLRNFHDRALVAGSLPFDALCEALAGQSGPVLMVQDALRTLSDYWTSCGCLTWRPYNSEVGAGTINPAAVLWVLGSEPRDVVYVELSVRPDDSRYGENLNRLQIRIQFQVALKSESGDPQELYLGSLEALGIDLDAHDVRFVEDSWAQPIIGAREFDWEVWLDGIEITQFTYFQQVGGQDLDLILVELTYGIERILMVQQRVTHLKDIAHAHKVDGSIVTYGEAFG